MRKEEKVYQIISGLNSIIREEMMPNPFEFVSENQLIVMLFTYLIGGTILHTISFNMCGVFYKRGKAPVLESIGYMIAFSLNVWILVNISKLFDSILAIGIIYIIIVSVIFKLLNKIKEIIFAS